MPLHTEKAKLGMPLLDPAKMREVCRLAREAATPGTRKAHLASLLSKIRDIYERAENEQKERRRRNAKIRRAMVAEYGEDRARRLWQSRHYDRVVKPRSN